MKQYKPPQKMLGASQVSSVLGVNKFLDCKTLKDRLENGYTRDIVPALQRGIKYESRVISIYQNNTGLTVNKAPFVELNRLGGCADGLIGKDGGIEVKCQFNDHRDPIVYHDYKIQSVAYMFLYKRTWWDIVVCRIDKDENVKVLIDRIYWKDYQHTWNDKWYPKITDFISNVQWAR